MSKVYRRVSCLREYVDSSLVIIGVYLAVGLINFIAYKIGIIDFTLDGYFEFSVGSISESLLVPFAFVYSILQQIIPIIISVAIFKEYNKSYYKKVNLINITPISNIDKLKNISYVGVVSFILYIVITCGFGWITLGVGNMLHDIMGLLYKICGSVFTLLNVIIADMLIRKSKFNTENKSIWYVLIIFTSMFIFMLIGMLISEITNIENGTSLICMIIIIIQCFYIFKNIEDIKIN